MPERPKVGLDNPELYGRLRQPSARAQSYYTERRIERHWVDGISPRGQSVPNNKAEPHKEETQLPNTEEDISEIGMPDMELNLPDQTSSKSSFFRRADFIAELSWPQRILVSMGCIVFMLGLYTSISSLRTNDLAKQQVSALSSESDKKSASTGGNNSDAPPSETKPKNIGSYRVAPDLPQTLVIPKINVHARIFPVGVNYKGELGAPSNIYDTAWYNASAKPGDAGSSGAMLIDGHVHGPTLPGVFVNLKKLVPGDTIQITRGDSKIFTYEVVKTELVPLDKFDMAEALASAKPGQPGLNLVTCGGSYDTAGNYDSRTIIFAVLRG